jgi:3',5'-cyclic AMP phosphodiesterase CpdA
MNTRCWNSSALSVRFLVLLAALFLAAGRAAAAAADTNAFWFVQITDTHFGVVDHDARARRVVDEINRLPMKIEFVLHTGDVFADNILKTQVVHTATSTLARLNMPLYVLPGNHDILPKKLNATLAAYTNAIGPLCRSVEHHGVRFLLLDTEPLREDFVMEGYDPLAWLERELRAAGRQPVIVCTHASSGEDFYGNTMHPGWPAAARANWARLLGSGNVRAELTGHFHRDELHWDGDVPVFISAPVAGFWGRQGSYRIYAWRAGRLSYDTCYLE